MGDSTLLEREGRVALISGAGSGIGRATALLLASRGAAVAVTDIDLDRAEQVAGEIEALGGRAMALRIDVAELEDAERAVAATIDHFGRLDWAVNNAAITGEHAPITETDPEIWSSVIRVNLVGVYAALRAQLRHMTVQGSGSIVNTGSITSVNGQAFTSAYNSSKHAVAGLTKTAALEAAGSGVRVNAVAPGYVRTPLLAGFTEELWATVAALHPIGRVAAPEEIAAPIAFLLSDEASFITGAVLLADGGFSAQ